MYSSSWLVDLDISKGISDPQHHWFDFIEGTAIVVVAVAAPELVLGVSIGSTIIDFFRNQTKYMNLIDLFFVSIYSHYYKMKKNGRNVIPWFETCCVIALSMAITASVLTKLIFGKSMHLIVFDNESVFLVIFILFGVLIFFLVKILFFNKGKHLKAMEIFLATYSNRQRKRNTIISLTLLVLTPLFIYLFLFLQAVNII